MMAILSQACLRSSSRWATALLTLCLLASGCGRSDLPDLGTVQGRVTLDGEPLSGVMVQFHSEKGGRPGTGMTDKDGNYELLYTTGAKGAIVGMNRVEVSTIWPDGEPPKGAREKVPTKYNAKSTLTKEVKRGHNKIDLELTSK